MGHSQPKPLKDNLGQIADCLKRHRHHFLFFDFDGTLVPIMERPSECWLDGKSRRLLSELKSHPQVTVGIISGRKLSDVRERVGVQDIIYAGNHGLEIEGPRFSFREPASDATRHELSTLVNRLRDELQFTPDAWIEHKRLTASVHFRQVAPVAIPHVLEVVQQVTEPAVQENRFILRQGKQVVEIRPNVEWDKSKAIAWIVNHTTYEKDSFIMFFGDDDTDEDVFVDRQQNITVCVGKKAITAAEFSLENQAEMPNILSWLKKSLSSIHGYTR